MKVRLNHLLVAGLSAAALLAVAAGAMAADKPGGPPPARVVTATVSESSVAETARVVGTLFFDRVSRLSAEVSGLVAGVSFREGDRVGAGDPMIELNTDFIQNEIDTVRATMAQIEARRVKAEKDLKRYETLYRQDAASEQDYDAMVLNRDDLAQQLVILSKTLDLALLKRAKSRITAPFEALVLSKNVDGGNWVSPGSTLCTLGSLDDLCVRAPVSEDLLLFSRPGQEVEIVIPALGKTLNGKVQGVMPVADPQTKTVFVKIGIPWLPGSVENMSATALLPSSRPRTMLLVPRDALVTYNGSNLVYTIGEGKAVPLPVTVVTYTGTDAAVTGQGLSAGMPVVVDGNDRLRPGQPVTVIDGKAQGSGTVKP